MKIEFILKTKPLIIKVQIKLLKVLSTKGTLQCNEQLKVKFYINKKYQKKLNLIDAKQINDSMKNLNSTINYCQDIFKVNCNTNK